MSWLQCRIGDDNFTDQFYFIDAECSCKAEMKIKQKVHIEHAINAIKVEIVWILAHSLSWKWSSTMKNSQWFSLSPSAVASFNYSLLLLSSSSSSIFRVSRRLTRFREFVVFIFHRAASKCFKAFCVEIRKIIENNFSHFLVAVWGPEELNEIVFSRRKKERKDLNCFSSILGAQKSILDSIAILDSLFFI